MSPYAKYVGTPWLSGGDDMSGFNCWNFVRHIQREHFGREMPQVRIDETRPMAFLRHLRLHPERKNWRQTAIPEEGDIVEMGIGRDVTHIGVWVRETDGGGILHCVQGAGVVFSNVFVVGADWPLLKYWRWVGPA